MRKSIPLMLFGLAAPIQVLAATGISPTSSILKMVLGLVVVLAVMALVSWLVKRMLPGAMNHQSAIRIIGGVSVGSRERVVVLEVADRWIVVGVAPGQVNGIANLEAGKSQSIEQPVNHSIPNSEQNIQHPMVHPIMQPLVKPFSEWLKKSLGKQQVADKLSEKSDAE